MNDLDKSRGRWMEKEGEKFENRQKACTQVHHQLLQT
jgi:hypothetical protein